MRYLIAAVLICMASVGLAKDTGFSAQDDAEVMARTGVLRHLGRNGGRREGVGMASTPEGALRRCCYYGRYRIFDQGVAWSPARRMWFACIRYE